MSEVYSTNRHQFSYDPEADVAYRTLDFMGFPGYCIGDDGSVLTSRYTNGRYGSPSNNIWKKRRLKPNSEGRVMVMLCPGINGFLVHRLVLFAFIGPCPDGMECCHGDGKPANNRIYNLRWDTPKANAADKVLHGVTNRGERQGGSKLTDDIVRQIRSDYASGEVRQKALAIRYGVGQDEISRVVNRKRWAHVV